MQKKLWVVLLTLAAVCCMVFGLASCEVEGNPSDTDKNPHTHTWAEAWSSDEKGHFHYATCEGHETVKDEVIPHTFKEGECTVCHYPDPDYEAEPSEGLNYELNEDQQSYSVSIGTCEDADIVIPSKHLGLPVTVIREEAFRSCTGLTSITIPNSVTSIGSDAFYRCNRLKKVYIYNLTAWCRIDFVNFSANPLWYAGHLYWKNTDTEITELEIPADITEIKRYAFYGCSGLTSIEIPDSVTSIGYRAFEGCSGLTSIVIGSGVTSIGSYAFSGCSGLASIEIPDSVTSISQYAFYGCIGLTSITIPDNVTSIGDWAFEYCSGLTSVAIGSGVTSIGNNAFLGCEGLTSIEIPNSVTSIGYNVFGYCGLTSIVVKAGNPIYHSDGNCLIETASGILIQGCTTSVIPNDGSVTSIDGWAFAYCDGLTSITIPDSVTSIGDYAFRGCSGLTSIVIGSGVTSIGDYAFVGCSGLTSITIPDSVTSIGSYAFYDCRELKSVVIGSGVTSIGYYAFYGCDKLETVYYKGTAKEWKEIKIGSDNGYLTRANRYYFTEDEPTAEEWASHEYWWHYDPATSLPTPWTIEE